MWRCGSGIPSSRGLVVRWRNSHHAKLPVARSSCKPPARTRVATWASMAAMVSLTLSRKAVINESLPVIACMTETDFGTENTKCQPGIRFFP